MSSFVPELDDIGYRELREASEARIPTDAPQWSEYNLSDPGITFLEMLSWLSDIELYRLNRITPEHLQRFLALLGDRYPTAKASSGMIVSTEGISADIEIEAGAVIMLEIEKRERLFVTKEKFYGNPARIEYIDILRSRGERQSITRTVDRGEIEPFYAFGEEPKEGDFFRLILDRVPSQRLNLYIELEESDLPSYTSCENEDYHWFSLHDSVELEWSIVIDKRAYRLKPKEDRTLNLRYSGVISFVIDEPMSIDSRDIWIVCHLKKSSYMIAPFIKNIYLNTIEIEQKEQIVERVTSSGEVNQEILLSHASLLDSDGRGVSIEVESSINDRESWDRVESLSHAKEDDLLFCYDNTKQSVLFGDGERGAIVPYGDTIICSYMITQAERGVIASSVDGWRIEGFDGLNFYNPKGVDGGVALSSYERRFELIREAMGIPTQAVTLEDYETLAKKTAGLRVARAKAFADRDHNHIRVVVVPYSRGDYPMPDDLFCKRVCRFLDSRRLITTAIEVVKPNYTEVGVTLHLKTLSSFDTRRIAKETREAIEGYLHPLRGGDSGDGWSFGRGVYLSDIYALVESIDGVSCVLDVLFNGEGIYDNRKKVYKIKDESLVRSLEHRVTFERSDLECGGLL